MIEIGVAGGSSLHVWQRFFSKANIIGIDVNPQCARFANKRVSITSVRLKAEQIQLVIFCCSIALGHFRRERCPDRHFFEYCHRKDLHQCVERRLQTEALFDDRHQHVHRDRDPDLRLHRVLRGSVEPLDPQMLLDPPRNR